MPMPMFVPTATPYLGPPMQQLRPALLLSLLKWCLHCRPRQPPDSGSLWKHSRSEMPRLLLRTEKWPCEPALLIRPGAEATETLERHY